MEVYEVKVYKSGNIYWHQNGELHRLDGPAIEYSDGTKSWYQNGELHRLDGPAVERVDGTKFWYIEDVEYTEKEFNKKIDERLILKEMKELANSYDISWYCKPLKYNYVNVIIDGDVQIVTSNGVVEATIDLSSLCSNPPSDIINIDGVDYKKVEE